MSTTITRLCIATVLLFLYLPLIVLIGYSFNDAQYSLMWHGITLKWYQALLHDNELWQALGHSLVLGILASTIGTTLGFLASLKIYLHKHYKPRLVTLLLYLLIIIPDIVFGVALLIHFNFSLIPLGFISLLIAHISFCLPFACLSINARLKTIDRNIYLAALDLGASDTKAIHKVFLPLMWPAILSAFLLSFTLSFDDVIISYFVSGPSFSILPLTLFSMVRRGITPEINALSSLTFMISLLVVVPATLLGKMKELG